APQVRKGAESKAGSAQERPRWDLPGSILCPNCGRQTTPTPLPEGRVRCSHCNSVFPLWASGQETARKTAKPLVGPPSKKPLIAAAGIAVALLFSLVLFRSHLFGKSDRLTVYRAQGKVEWEGKPIANATLFLHPVGRKSPSTPRPRAIVGEDGTF